MKFNNEAYEKLYPRQTVKPKVETAVDGFTPSVAENESDKEKIETVVETETEVTDGGDGADSTVSE